MADQGGVTNVPPGDAAGPLRMVVGSARAYSIVLLLVMGFITYGSLFPFEYIERSYPGGPFAYLWSTRHDWDGRGDLLSNIMLYLPFGFFGTGSLPQRLPIALRVVLVTVVGAALSCGFEAAQFNDAGRVTSMGDVYANAIGAAIGSIALSLVGVSMRWPFVRELIAHPSASLLLVMFFAYRLYPYEPVIDLHKYWHAVQPMLTAPELPPDELLRYVITWLFIGVILHSLYGFRGFLLLFPLLCGVEFVGKIIIVDDTLKLTDIVGGAVAYLLWALLLRWLPGRFVIVALAYAGMVAAERLQPFQFTSVPHSFGWIPFASFMRGSAGVAIQAFCEKFYQYGGMIWLLGRVGVTLPSGMALTALLLFVTSYAERWLPGRSAEITDAAMVLAIGGAFALLRHAAREHSDVMQPDTAAAREQARLAAAVLAQHTETAVAPNRGGGKYAPYVPPRLRG